MYVTECECKAFSVSSVGQEFIVTLTLLPGVPKLEVADD